MKLFDPKIRISMSHRIFKSTFHIVNRRHDIARAITMAMPDMQTEPNRKISFRHQSFFRSRKRTREKPERPLASSFHFYIFNVAVFLRNQWLTELRLPTPSVCRWAIRMNEPAPNGSLACQKSITSREN